MKRLLIGLIRWYQTYVSPGKPPCCRFEPTCSQYAIQAITEWGAFRGTALAIWRVLRCNPLCKPGYDPVPHRHKKLEDERFELSQR